MGCAATESWPIGADKNTILGSKIVRVTLELHVRAELELFTGAAPRNYPVQAHPIGNAESAEIPATKLISGTCTMKATLPVRLNV